MRFMATGGVRFGTDRADMVAPVAKRSTISSVRLDFVELEWPWPVELELGNRPRSVRWRRPGR
jgi:hypothetical protein